MLRGALNMDSDSWTRLAKTYGPTIYHWARLAKLQPQDANEIVQEVFQTIFRKLDTFEQRSFRGWLWVITRNAIMYRFRCQKNIPTAEGGSDFHRRVQSIPESEPQDEAEIQVEIDREKAESEILYKSLEMIRGDFEEQTWQAFWQTAVEQKDSKIVAEELGLTLNSIRQARFRVRQRLKQFLDLHVAETP
jgi:RNA polymerase sigma-70 factor (ECF subfamily)